MKTVRKRSTLARAKDHGMSATITRDGCKAFEARFPQARCLWEQKVPNVGTITAYSLGLTIVLIQEYRDSNGWNAFTPTTDDGRIDSTLDAIAERAGICSARTDGGVCTPFRIGGGPCEYCGKTGGKQGG